MSTPDWIPNPFVTVLTERNGDEIARLELVAPIKGRSLLRTPFERAQEPRLFALLLRVAEAQGELDLEIAEDDMSRLAEVGFLVTEDQLPSAVQFECWLDEVDSPAQAAGDGPLVLNPTLSFYESGPPEQIAGAPLSRDHFRQDAPMLSLVEPGYSAASLYWLRDGEVEAIRSLCAGRGVEHVPAEMRQKLVRAGVLIPAEHTPSVLGLPPAEHFQNHGHALLRHVASPTQLRALQRYYAALLAQGLITLGDRQVEFRYSRHNERASQFWHRQLAPIIGAVVGEPVKPSYSYFAAYEPGAMLPRHTDRPQCEFTVSLLIDYSPTPEHESPWPIFLEYPDGREVGVRFGVNDALCFKGRELAHRRDPLPAGQRSTHLLFHYVRPDFEGTLF